MTSYRALPIKVFDRLLVLTTYQLCPATFFDQLPALSGNQLQEPLALMRCARTPWCEFLEAWHAWAWEGREAVGCAALSPDSPAPLSRCRRVPSITSSITPSDSYHPCYETNVNGSSPEKQLPSVAPSQRHASLGPTPRCCKAWALQGVGAARRRRCKA